MSMYDKAFSQLEDAAAKGARCPMREMISGGGASVSQLAREGLIFVEIYTRNFRRVTILAGPHKGKKTADAPLDHNKQPAKPYLTVGKDGTRRNGKIVDTGWKKRPAPSLLDYSRGA